jgi:septal ring factor EnvC (AmiA/AmiB activator)
MENWSRQDLLNKINKLEDELKESKRLNTQNRNKINRLEADLASVEDYSDKQAEVIKHYFNQIKGLVNGQR